MFSECSDIRRRNVRLMHVRVIGLRWVLARWLARLDVKAFALAFGGLRFGESLQCVGRDAAAVRGIGSKNLMKAKELASRVFKATRLGDAATGEDLLYS